MTLPSHPGTCDNVWGHFWLGERELLAPDGWRPGRLFHIPHCTTGPPSPRVTRATSQKMGPDPVNVTLDSSPRPPRPSLPAPPPSVRGPMLMLRPHKQRPATPMTTQSPGSTLSAPCPFMSLPGGQASTTRNTHSPARPSALPGPHHPLPSHAPPRSLPPVWPRHRSAKHRFHP